MNKQQGAAVIVALFIVAIIVILVNSMLGDQQIALNRTQSLRQTEHAYITAQSLQDKGQALLMQWQAQPIKQQVQQRWPWQIKLKSSSAQQAELSIIDAQSFFNINSLQGPQKALARAVLQQLIKQKLPELETEQQQKILAEISKPLANITLLQNLPGLTAKQYQRLAPYLIALPKAAKLNVNTISKQLIMSLGSDISADQADEFITTRHEHAYQSLGEFSQFANIARHGVPTPLLDVTSRYFLFIIKVNLNEQQFSLYSLQKLYEKKPGVFRITSLWQTWNTL